MDERQQGHLLFGALYSNGIYVVPLQKYPAMERASDGTATEKGKHHTLYYHRIGTKQSDDVLIAQFPHEPDFMV